MEGNEVVTLNLDRPRALRLTNRVLKRFLSSHNLKMSDLEKAMQDYVSMTELVCEMLQADDPELTQEYCDELLDNVPIADIINAAAEAITVGITGEGTANPPQAKNGRSAG